MGIKPKFNIEVLLKNGLQENQDALIRGLRRIGLEAVNRARQDGSYTDRTGNLRRSTGYLVAVKGSVVESLFGNDVARNYAMQVLSEYKDTDIVLLVFAGMNYASYVQSRGYNVLASAEIEAEKRINELFKQL